ncbi:hypothetical protein Tco_0792994 [Tanacetum coccineum]
MVRNGINPRNNEKNRPDQAKDCKAVGSRQKSYTRSETKAEGFEVGEQSYAQVVGNSRRGPGGYLREREIRFKKKNTPHLLYKSGHRHHTCRS